jgi:hypothetical protein
MSSKRESAPPSIAQQLAAQFHDRFFKGMKTRIPTGKIESVLTA